MPYSIHPDEGYTVDADDVDYLDDALIDGGDRWVLNFGPQHPDPEDT